MVSGLDIEWQRSPLGPQLPFGEGHLWLRHTRAGSGDVSVLSPEERRRAAGFRFASDRERWVAARVLLRVVLGRYLGVPPDSVVLEAGDKGRPFVRWPDHSEWMCFSPTHSGDVALVAVARETSIGVDVERIRPDLDFLSIARRALGDDIADQLGATPDKARVRQFFREWVREEARGKCRGTGLVEPEDEARSEATWVIDVAVEDGYAGALATAVELERVRGCVVEVNRDW
jgi:4'-phosphopantetheinyl transferase